MKKYLIEKMVNGELEEKEIVESEKEIEEFCIELLEREKEKVREESGGEEGIEEYISEFFGYGEFNGVWEVNMGEGIGYDVYEVS